MSQSQMRLGVVLSLIVLAVVVLLRFGTPPDDRDPDATAVIWSVARDEVEKVEIVRSAGRLVLSKSGDDWTVAEPFSGPADSWKAGDLVNDLTQATRGVPVSDADPAVFGLGSTPVATVVVTLKDGSTRELHVGDKAPVGNRTYVQAADGSVAALSGDLYESVTADANDYRDTRVLQFPAANATRITIASAEGELDLRKDAAGWWLTEFTRGDEGKVEDLIYSLMDLRFDSFEQEPEAGSPTHTLTLIMQDGSAHVMSAGETTSKGVYVDVDGGSSGYVAADAVKFLGQGPRDVGDHHGIPIDRNEATRVEVDLGGKRWVMEKDGETWKRDGKAESAAESALGALEGVEIHYRDPKNEPVPPISERFGTVKVVTALGERTIEFGQTEGEFRVARDLAGGGTYLVTTTAMDRVRDAFGG